MGRISTHILDTAAGTPAAGVRIDVSALNDGQWQLLKTVHTNTDGRTDEPLLSGDELQVGQFQLEFHIGDHYRRGGIALPDPLFIDRVPLRFGVADVNENYHVPLLASPWSYSTYRGS